MAGSLGSRRSAGSLFQADGAEIAKARGPIVKVCDVSTNNRERSAIIHKTFPFTRQP